VDNVSMDRVEFYLDGRKINESTVAPYSALWTIAMSDTIPVAGTVVTQTQTVVNPDGTSSEQVITLTQVITVPSPEAPDEILQYMQVYSGGLTIISNTTSITPGIGYTETHTLKFIAYDAAGNETESEPTTFSVIHDPEALEEESPQAVLFPTQHAVDLHSARIRWIGEEPMARLLPLASSVIDRQAATGGKSPPG